MVIKFFMWLERNWGRKPPVHMEGEKGVGFVEKGFDKFTQEIIENRRRAREAQEWAHETVKMNLKLEAELERVRAEADKDRWAVKSLKANRTDLERENNRLKMELEVGKKKGLSFDERNAFDVSREIVKSMDAIGIKEVPIGALKAAMRLCEQMVGRLEGDGE